MSALTYQYSIEKPQAEQSAIKKALNDYLFAEYGFDLEDESRVSKNWPFELRALGTIQMPDGDVYVFEFDDGHETYFAISGQSITYYQADGMTLHDLRLQMIGSQWIAKQGPVGLNTARLADSTVPPSKQRQTAIEALAAQALPDDPAPRIREGLFLESTRSYLALVEHSLSGRAFVVGSDVESWSVDIPTKSVWRKLAFGVGQMVVEGKLPTANA